MKCFSKIGKAFTAIKNALFPKAETGVSTSAPADHHDQQHRSSSIYRPGYYFEPSPARLPDRLPAPVPNRFSVPIPERPLPPTTIPSTRTVYVTI